MVFLEASDLMIELTELFANHTFVGIVDGYRRLAAVQHGVKLYLVDYGAVWYVIKKSHLTQVMNSFIRWHYQNSVTLGQFNLKTEYFFALSSPVPWKKTKQMV